MSLSHLTHLFVFVFMQDSHFIYSFSPIPGINRLFIRLAEAPTAKVTHSNQRYLGSRSHIIYTAASFNPLKAFNVWTSRGKNVVSLHANITVACAWRIWGRCRIYISANVIGQYYRCCHGDSRLWSSGCDLHLPSEEKRGPQPAETPSQAWPTADIYFIFLSSKGRNDFATNIRSRASALAREYTAWLTVCGVSLYFIYKNLVRVM